MNLLILTQKVDKGDDNLGFFHEWIRKFAERTDRVFVVANFAGEHSLPANTEIFSLGKEKKFGRLRRYINFYKYIFQILPQADAVFVHMIPAWVILAWPVAMIYRKKIFLWYTHKSVTRSLLVAEKLVKKIFTASAESCRIKSKKIVVTGHGIDTGHFVPKDLNRDGAGLRFLAVGRVTPAKDHEFLIGAIAIVIQNGHRATLDIVGMPITQADFTYKKKLTNLIQQKKIEKNINFLGTKTYAEMPDVYTSHDALLHASETGSLDKAVLEAMSCGLPVFTTSKAFSGMLKVIPKDVRVFAEQISQMTIGQKDMSLREIIIQNHNLDNLISKIVELIRN